MVAAFDVLAVAGAISGVPAENNFGDTRSGGLAGPMGLLIIVLMSIATVLLIRNMNARLRRLPDRFPGQEDDSPGQEDAATGAADGQPAGDDDTASPGQRDSDAQGPRP
jgi:hypothetical protein